MEEELLESLNHSCLKLQHPDCNILNPGSACTFNLWPYLREMNISKICSKYECYFDRKKNDLVFPCKFWLDSFPSTASLVKSWASHRGCFCVHGGDGVGSTSAPRQLDHFQQGLLTVSVQKYPVSAQTASCHSRLSHGVWRIRLGRCYLGEVCTCAASDDLLLP